MIQIDGNHLTVEEIIKVARLGESVELSELGLKNIAISRQRLEAILESKKPVYGINTGFGIFADKRIRESESAQLSRNLILSHAVGTGTPFEEEIVRASMLVRANTLAKGFSGVRLIVVETLLAMINKGVTPVVPSQGSLGSSGDLGPLSHMALVFTTGKDDTDENSGFACFLGNILPGKLAMERAKIDRIILGPKEGLAINNGATFTAAIGALAIADSEIILDSADISASMSLEALLGCLDAFDERLHLARGHSGQIEVAGNIRKLVEGSTLINSTNRIQDAYSLRCAPQIQGPARETLVFVKQIIEKEINAATDNPLLVDELKAVSGGNFHGEPVGMAMDFLSIAIAEVGAVSERRTFRLTDGQLNQGLPPMLVDSLDAAGLNSGLMMPQYTAASLVLENQTLASPDSVRSLPTSSEQEDHNANATTAARHARQIIANCRHIIAIELFTASRALDLRLRDKREFHAGKLINRYYQKIREVVPYCSDDCYWGPQINKVRALVDQGAFRLEIRGKENE